MGQGDDDYASLFSSPLWITDGVGLGVGAGVGGEGSIITEWGSVCSNGVDPDSASGIATGTATGTRTVNSDGTISENDGGDDHVEINKSFLDTETLCSHSNFTYPSSYDADTGSNSGTSTPVRKRAHAHVNLSTATITTTNAEDPFADQTSYNSGSFMSFSTGKGAGAGFDAGTGIAGPQESRDAGNDTFLLSRQTSAATMAMTTSPIAATEAASNANLPPSFSHLLFDSPSQTHLQEPDHDLRLPLDPGELERASESCEALGIMGPNQWQRQPKQHHDYELFNDLDFDHLFPDSFLNQAALEHRPSSSRSHLRYWPHNSKGSISDAARLLRISSDESSPIITDRPSMALSREEFEALPPTIQRKYFSTLERLRFVSPDSIEAILPRSAEHDQPWSRPSTSKHSKRSKQPDSTRVPSNSSNSSQLRSRITSTDQQFYANLPEKIKRRHLTEEEKLVAECHRRSVILDAADEAFIKLGRRHSEGLVEPPLMSPGLSDCKTSTSSMHSQQGNKTMLRPASKKTDSFYDSFRWLEEDDELDLRLYLDDYHINLREEIPLPSKSRRPSFRRHLSINKLPFGRPSISQSRPGTTDNTTPPPFFTSPNQSPALGSLDNNHGRKKSRALSLISANRQPLPDQSAPFDPAATHYQDPEARMKLKVYLASPQKFDEAIEFGFPSMDGLRIRNDKMSKQKGNRAEKPLDSDKLRTFLEDDLSASDSDDVSLAEPESPKTPELFEKPVPPRKARASTDRANPRGEYAHAPAMSRDMTLRMTLTRPDLRSSEEQIYGWKQNNAARGVHSRDDSSPNPVIYARDGNSKDSIEKQLAAIDQWNENNNKDTANPEPGAVKRFWNRMKWS